MATLMVLDDNPLSAVEEGSAWRWWRRADGTWRPGHHSHLIERAVAGHPAFAAATLTMEELNVGRYGEMPKFGIGGYWEKAWKTGPGYESRQARRAEWNQRDE